MINKKPSGREKLITNKSEEEIMPLGVLTGKSEVFIGQEQLLKKVNALVDKTKATKKPLPHMLFVGEEGMGKETLAGIIAKKLNRKITATFGDAIEQAGDLIGILTNLAEGDILLINSIEKMKKVVNTLITEQRNA